MSKELDKVNEIHHTKAIYKVDGTTVIESSLFNLLVAYAKEALQRLESIDNSNPSEALEELEQMREFGNHFWVADKVNKSYMTIKQALLKAQEPKQYLKWEDLEFKEEEQTMKVLLNGNKYTLNYYSDGYDDYIDFLTDNEQDRIAIYEGGYPHDKQFFNDLHLERVEE